MAFTRIARHLLRDCRAQLLGLMLGVFMLLSVTVCVADEHPPTGKANELAAKIDAFLLEQAAQANIDPAPPASDAEFFRRVSLDLGGRIPLVWQARDFMENPSPDKRWRAVEELLSSPRYVNRFVNVWRKLMLPEAAASFQKRFITPGFENWLRERLRDNTPYDQIVRELLSTPVSPRAARFVAVRNSEQTAPTAFYAAKDFQPENLAAAASRLFLGVQLECAQCHDHPFADWKQDQFWSFAAFFAGIRYARQGQNAAFSSGNRPEVRRIKIPDTDRVVQAAYLDGSAPDWSGDKPGVRQVLADWITAQENPYFARVTVNRIWAELMGRGLVDPVEGMFDETPTSRNLPILEELAQAFIENGFDLKFLIRSITYTQAYQRTSAQTSPGQDQSDLFMRMPLRGLSAEQLYDSLVAATGDRGPAPQRNQRRVFRPGGSPREEFLSLFANDTDRPVDQTTSILQALALMNGNLTSQATDLQQSETLAAVLDSPFMNLAQRIEALYLATLSRKPTEKELAKMVAYVERRASALGDQDPERNRQALADVFWVLLNSSEFGINH